MLENTSSFASEPTMDMESMTHRAACAAVMAPFAASSKLTGSVPNSVAGNSAKASFMVTQVELNHLITKVL